jgi:altronate hydrolase
LSLVCAPGHDVESVTALAAAGANLVAFTTGLGTAVGSALAPVLKVASHTELAARRGDIIDFDAGPVVDGAASVDELGAALLARCIDVASGRAVTRAEGLGQEDFMPWRRGFSL